MLAVKACVQAKGYDWEFQMEAGGFSITGGSGLEAGQTQIEREQEDLRACYLEVDPARLAPPPPLTASQYEQMFRYMLAQTECMRAAGYPVSDPPPLEVYIDSNRAFDPYSDLRSRGINFSHDDLVRCQSVDEMPDFMK